MGLSPAQRFELRASAETTTATTEVGEWFEVADFNELYAWLDVSAFAARSDETLDVTIEREADNAAGYVTLLTFTQIATTGAHTEEKSATSLIGGRIRMRAVTAGTWSSKSITFAVHAYAKSA